MYRVVRYFEDLQDNGYAYKAGDKFPREGMTVSDARINILSSADNLQHTKLIEWVDDDPIAEDSPIAENEKVYDEDSLSELTTREIKALAAERGYKITQYAKAKVIEQFLSQQR